MLNTAVAGTLLFLNFLPNQGLEPANNLNFNHILAQSRIEREEVDNTTKKDARFKKLSESEIVLDVPYVNQYDDLPENRKAEIMRSACGPTALTMSFLYHGVDTDLITVIDKLPTSVYVKGVMFYNLYIGGEIYDFEHVKIEANPRSYYETLKEGKPIIMNVQNYQGFIGHALVITGIKGYDAEEGTAESLIVHDPFTGPAYREFKITGPNTLEQPEGYTNYIGILEPFYIVPKN